MGVFNRTPNISFNNQSVCGCFFSRTNGIKTCKQNSEYEQHCEKKFKSRIIIEKYVIGSLTSAYRNVAFY